MDFNHRTNYGQNKPVNKAILIFNEYCGLFGFRDDESRYVIRNDFCRAVSGERFHLLCKGFMQCLIRFVNIAFTDFEYSLFILYFQSTLKTLRRGFIRDVQVISNHF
jgi:hypothetical protein